VPEPRVILKSSVGLVLCLLIAIPLSAKKGHKTAPPASANKSGYDVARDPAKDLQDAIAEATRTNKRILMEVGGDWCVYCAIMDTAFDSHPQLKKVRDTSYVMLKVNFSKENPNEAFLSHYPHIPDYPHFFVLDSKGALLHSQPTHGFEHGKNYNVAKIDAFLKKWAQPPRHWLTNIG
jgi:thiol:disulfide interchange protein